MEGHKTRPEELCSLNLQMADLGCAVGGAGKWASRRLSALFSRVFSVPVLSRLLAWVRAGFEGAET